MPEAPAAPVVTPAAATPAKPAAQTPAAPVKMGDGFRSLMRGDKPKPEAKKTPETPAAPAKEAAKETPATHPADPKAGEAGTPPAAPAKPAPAKRVIRRAKDYVDAPTGDAAVTKLAETVGQMAKAIEGAATPKPTTPAEPTIVLSEEEQDQLEVLQAMGEMDKDKFGHLADGAKRYIADFPAWEEKWTDKFRQQWERKNDKDDFKTDEDREAAFAKSKEESFGEAVAEQRKKYRLDYSDRDFKKGEQFLTAKPLQEKLERQERELAELKRGAHEQSVAPVAKDHGSRAVADLAVNFVESNKEFEGLITEEGTIDAEKLKALPDAKIVEPILNSVLDSSRKFGEAAALLLNGGKTPHAELVTNVCLDFEHDMSQRPEAEQVVDGKKFSPLLKFVKMPPAEKAKHWTVNAELVIAFANDNIITRATKDIAARREAHAEQEKEFRAKYKLPDDAPTAANGHVKNGDEAAAAARTAKPKIASTTDGTPSGAAVPIGGSSRLAALFKQPVIATGMAPK